ncbi:hypothetical protein ACFPYI_06205 [Halomarina salina]|uniref:Uncharacterized protein n=1 Tax=Halomarina salina TaxID=1872699 RepID=A0ABD5RKL0_9EURY|nr:hypothetical protein [Halomarina salina]
MSDGHSVKSYVAQHPKLVGMLFTAMLFGSQLGTVAADGSTHVGP